MLWETQQLLAFFWFFNGTVQKVEHKSRTGPLSANYSCNAVKVENVLTTVRLNARFLLEELREAHLAVFTFFCIFFKLIMHKNTVLV
jgi:hypothetical protein